MDYVKSSDFETITPIQLAIICDTLDEFDFDKVEAYMDDINWCWRSHDEEGNEIMRVPNQTELRAALRKMLLRSYACMNESMKMEHIEAPVYSSCGGFTVYVWPDDTCQVYFSVTDHWVDNDWIESLSEK